MQEPLNTALLVLIVGMLTVFTVLFLVVQTGRLLIYLVNTYAPAPKVIKKKPRTRIMSEPQFSSSKIAAIITAVEIATQGKGSVTAITRVNDE